MPGWEGHREGHNGVSLGEGILGADLSSRLLGATALPGRSVRESDGEEALDHRVYLLWYLELTEVAGAHGLAVQDPGEHIDNNRGG